ncbi:hypothetical protein DMC01_01960 [Campylobacter troglodytis]|nr:hypothetical protein DMC01_01960 [Campylobacter troglodytis]
MIIYKVKNKHIIRSKISEAKFKEFYSTFYFVLYAHLFSRSLKFKAIKIAKLSKIFTPIRLSKI